MGGYVLRDTKVPVVVEAKNLSKEYKTHNHRSILSYFWGRSGTYTAIKDLSFQIAPGEAVALLGTNGAGKSTLIKLLTGVLYSEQGELTVFGRHPFKHRRKNVREMGVVFGQKTQLRWDIPPIESYHLLRAIYDVEKPLFEDRLRELGKILDIESFLYKPVRTLSLGQKMRAELVAAFLHGPQFVILDEPTIGLDLFTKYAIYDFLQEIRQKQEVTLLLTTHDTQNLEAVCERSLIIDRGQIIYDGPTAKLRTTMGSLGGIEIICEQRQVILPDSAKGFRYKVGPHTVEFFEVDSERFSVILKLVQKKNTIKDIRIRHTSFDQVLKKFYETTA